MDYQRAISYLRKGKILPLYILIGNEFLLKEHFVDILSKVILKDNISPMNYKVVYGSDFEPSLFSMFLKTGSLFGGKKLFVLKNYSEMKPAHRKVFLKFLEEFINKNVKNILVITDTEMSKDPILDIGKKKGLVIEFDIPNFETLVSWVRSGIETKGKRIDEDAIYLLLAHRNNELLSIKNEIDKLIIYAGDEDVITVGMVKALLGLRKGVTIFDLISAIRERDGIGALFILRELMYEEPIQKIVYSIENEIKKMITIKILMGKGADYNTIKQKMGLSTHVLNEIIAHLPQFSKEELIYFLKLIYKTHLSSRENYTLSTVIAENLIKEITQSQ